MKMGAILRGGEGGLHILSREKSKLSQRLLVVWTKILLDYLQNLVELMSSQNEAVKNVEGGPININLYYFHYIHISARCDKLFGRVVYMNKEVYIINNKEI